MTTEYLDPKCNLGYKLIKSKCKCKKTKKKEKVLLIDGKCTGKQIEECKSKGKQCNPKTARCNIKKNKTKKVKKKKTKKVKKKKTKKVKKKKTKKVKKKKTKKVKKKKTKKVKKKKTKKVKKKKTESILVDGKCTEKQIEKCKINGKLCNPKTGRCNVIKKTKKTKKVKKVKETKKQIVKLSKIQIKSIGKPVLKSYSPSINKELGSLKSNSGDDVLVMVNELYDCKDKLKIRINDRCVGYDNVEAQKTMLQLLNTKEDIINVNLLIGPRQSLSNCWLNSFFMCYFISDKGRKFFRHLRRIMITGQKKINGRYIGHEFREGLWLLNKTIQATLVSTPSTEKFITHADTNNVIRLLRGDGTGKRGLIQKTRLPSNPLQFYKNLFTVLGMKKGVHFMEIKKKRDYNAIFKKTTEKHKAVMLKATRNVELILMTRRDDSTSDDINSREDKIKKEFYIGKNKFVLDSTVLRSKCRKHFTSYVTIKGVEFAFEGGAFRRLRKFKWKDIITKGVERKWSFGTPIHSQQHSKPKKGYRLNEEFDFNNGYQINFYYRV